MTTKLTSAEAYEYIKTTEFVSYPSGVFERTDIETLLREAAAVHSFTPPSAKSFLDWARREDIVEAVEGKRGHYRWAPTVEAEAAEIGRQWAEEAGLVPVTDSDPEHPMIPEPVEAETCQHRAEDLEDLSEVADVRAYIVSRQVRIPRKEKKRMKKMFRDATGVEKVQICRESNLGTAWELANR